MRVHEGEGCIVADRPDVPEVVREPLYLSQVYAAITAVEGVGSAEVTEFHRYGDPPAGELSRGAIGVGRTEVIRLDNDPNFPDNGLLKLTLRSGK